MRLIVLIIATFMSSVFLHAQSSFDVSLNEISADITNKLSIKNKKKIVVLFITDINKAQTVAGKYIADILSVNIVNSPGNFEVFDRDNLSSITEAKKLIAEGYIDVSSAQQLGKLLSVEAILVGNYTVLNTSIKLSVKAIDVNSGLVIAASLKDLPLSPDVGSLLGINISSTNSENTSNRGFNGQPLNSNEVYNNDATVESDCNTYIFGNYCFKNALDKQITVVLAEGTWKSSKKQDQNKKPLYFEPYPGSGDQLSFTLDQNQTQCIYELKPGPVTYKIILNGTFIKLGEIYVEKCKSKTFIIK